MTLPLNEVNVSLPNGSIYTHRISSQPISIYLSGRELARCFDEEGQNEKTKRCLHQGLIMLYAAVRVDVEVGTKAGLRRGWKTHVHVSTLGFPGFPVTVRSVL